ncbi:MAG: sugar transferase [Candidatus Sulfotelmatobacter sp.]
MSSLPLHPRQPKRVGIEWAARLIPGAGLSVTEKKARRGAGTKISFRDAATLHPSAPAKDSERLPVRTFAGMEGLARANCVWSTLPDYAIVMLAWVLVAQICLQLHVAFPSMPSFADLFPAWSVSHTLIGIALLHGVLINRLNSLSRLQTANTNLSTQVKALGKTVFWGTLTLSAALHLQGCTRRAEAAVWSAGMLHFILFSAWKWLSRDSCGSSLRSTRGVRNVLIVGAGTVGRRLAKHVAEHPEMDRSVYGFLDDQRPLENGIIGRTSDLTELARSGFVDEVILASPHDQQVTLRVLHAARQLRLDLKMAPQLFGCEPFGRLESLGNIPLISLHEETVPVAGLLVKRAMDVASSGIALIALAPALFLIAILIKMESSGPILYNAPRAGRKRRPFPCYKFRTMVRNADDLKESLRQRNQRSGPFFKITHDPRITRVGRFLRRYSLDELPQLWNVLRGDMSMVGPRPHPLDDVSRYAIADLPRLDVTPGITGLWQVTDRQDPSFQNGLKLEIEYSRRWSLRMDLSILLKTAVAVLRGSGE